MFLPVSGYRCFKAVMFLTGLMFGSVVIFMLCYKERVLDTQLSVEASVGIGLGIGTLCGLVTMLVRSVGLFMVGLLLGLLVAVATLVGMEELSDSPPRSVWVPLGVLLGLGMLFAVLTLQWQRLFTTLSTAVFGAAVITVALDYFVELFALVLYMYERMKAAPGKPVCWITWVVLGVWPALTLLGVIVQWKVTAEGYSHTKGKQLVVMGFFVEHKRMLFLDFWLKILYNESHRRFGCLAPVCSSVRWTNTNTVEVRGGSRGEIISFTHQHDDDISDVSVLQDTEIVRALATATVTNMLKPSY